MGGRWEEGHSEGDTCRHMCKRGLYTTACALGRFWRARLPTAPNKQHPPWRLRDEGLRAKLRVFLRAKLRALLIASRNGYN